MWFSKLNTIKFKEGTDGSDTNSASLKKDRLVRIPYRTAISIQSGINFGNANIKLADINGKVLTGFAFFKDCRSVANSNKFHTIIKIKKNINNPQKAKVRFMVTLSGVVYFSKLFYLVSETQNNKIVTFGDGVAFDGTVLSDYSHREQYYFYHYCDFSIFQKKVNDSSIVYNDNNGTLKNLRVSTEVADKCYFGNKYYLPEWQAIALRTCLRFQEVYALFWTNETKTILKNGYKRRVRVFKTAKLECNGELELEYISPTATNTTISGYFQVTYDKYSSIIDYDQLDLSGDNISIWRFSELEKVPILFLTSPQKKVKLNDKVIDFTRIREGDSISLRAVKEIPDNFCNEKNSKELFFEEYTPFKKIGDNTFENVEFWDGNLTLGEVTVGKNFKLTSQDFLILSQPEIDGLQSNNVFLTRPTTIKNMRMTTNFQNRKFIKRIENSNIVGHFENCEIINCEAMSPIGDLSFADCKIENSFNNGNIKLSANSTFTDINNSFNRISINNASATTFQAISFNNSFLDTALSTSATLTLSKGKYDNQTTAYRLTISVNNYISINGVKYKNLFSTSYKAQNFSNGIVGLPATITDITVNITDGETFNNQEFLNFKNQSKPVNVTISKLENFMPSPYSFVDIDNLTINYSDFARAFPSGNMFIGVHDIEIIDDVDVLDRTSINYVESNLIGIATISSSGRIVEMLQLLYPDIIYNII